MRRFLRDTGLAALGLGVLAAVSAAPPPFEIAFLRLLQPEWLIEQRTTAEELAKTSKAVTAVVERWATAQPPGRNANACTVFLALRPQRRLKTWTVCAGGSAPAEPAELDERIAKEVVGEEIAAVTGLVVFSIHGSTAGESYPKPWTEATRGEAMEIGQLVDSVWPDRKS